MIDTIEIHIHNISEYKQLYEQYFAFSKKKTGVTTAYINEDTGEVIEYNQNLGMVFHDTGRILPINHRNSKHIASSHYSLSYRLNSSTDTLEFNFSIPKYLYSTNVFEFIARYDQSPQAVYAMLRTFILEFIRDNCIQQPQLKDVEIKRIDFCYNQYFSSIEDALRYLDEQKELFIKYARSSSNSYRNYDTSMQYVTRRYSFKIYHKGTEFRKHDKSELVKSPNKLRIPLEYIEQQADKILRYEMTFRNSMLNWVFSQNFLESKRKAENPFVNNHPLFKFLKKLVMLTNIRNNKNFERWLKGSKMFTVTSHSSAPEVIDELINENSITFDYTIFSLLHSEFRQRVNAYQITEACDYQQIKNRIKELNDIQQSLKDNGLNGKTKDAHRMLTAGLLLQKYSWSDLKELMPSRTFYRLRKDLLHIGITESTRKINIPAPRTDYFDFFLMLTDKCMRNCLIKY